MLLSVRIYAEKRLNGCRDEASISDEDPDDIMMKMSMTIEAMITSLLALSPSPSIFLYLSICMCVSFGPRLFLLLSVALCFPFFHSRSAVDLLIFE